jgi:transcription elongation factor GreA
MSKTILTSAGKRKLQEELHFLSTIEKKRLINEVADARDRGGVSENSEYEIAREEFDNLQKRISRLEGMINNSTIVSSADIDLSKVSILSTVKVLNKKAKKESKFTIVPETDIDVKSGKISSNSPIGSGLLGKKIGEIAKIETPIGVLEFKILEITA